MFFLTSNFKTENQKQYIPFEEKPHLLKLKPSNQFIRDGDLHCKEFTKHCVLGVDL